MAIMTLSSILVTVRAQPHRKMLENWQGTSMAALFAGMMFEDRTKAPERTPTTYGWSLVNGCWALVLFEASVASDMPPQDRWYLTYRST
eukprot:2307674-Amphidinium_carterae.1